MSTHRRVSRLQDGFTLLELMLVVSIIGILAAVALPAYQDYVNRAKISEGLTLAAPAQKAVAAYYDRWGKLPADNANATLAAPIAFAGRYVSAVEVKLGVVNIAFSNLASKLPDASLTLRPAINKANPTGPLVWVCNSAQVPAGFEAVGAVATAAVQDKMLPAACRA